MENSEHLKIFANSTNFSCCFFWCCTFCFWFSEIYFTVFTFSLLGRMLSNIFQKFLCSYCNNKEPLLSSNDFSHQARFYGKFRHHSFACLFNLYFVLHQKFVCDRRKSWSCWNLQIGYVSAKEVILNYCYMCVRFF